MGVVTKRRSRMMKDLRMMPPIGEEMMMMDQAMNQIRRMTANTRMKKKATKKNSWSKTVRSR